MESGMGAEALRAWDAICRQLLGRSRELTVTMSQRGRRAAAESRCRGPNRDSLSRPLAAGMRTELLSAAWLAARNGYGDAQHVS